MAFTRFAALFCLFAKASALNCNFSGSCDLYSETNVDPTLVAWEPKLAVHTDDSRFISTNDNKCEWTSDKFALETPCGSVIMLSQQKDDRYMLARGGDNKTRAWLISPTVKSTKLELDYWLSGSLTSLSICKRFELKPETLSECVWKTKENRHAKQIWKHFEIDIPASDEPFQVVLKAEVPDSNSVVAIDNVAVKQEISTEAVFKPDFEAFANDPAAIIRLLQVDPNFFLPPKFITADKKVEKKLQEKEVCKQIECKFNNNTCQWTSYPNTNLSSWKWASARESIRKVGTKPDADGGIGVVIAAKNLTDDKTVGYAMASPKFKLESPAILKFSYYYRGGGGYLDVCEDSVSMCMIRLQNVELIKHQMDQWRDAQLILHPGVHKIVLVARELESFGIAVDNLQLLSVDLSQPAKCTSV